MTAGPEALPQLVAELNVSGGAAAIIAISIDRTASVPEAYRNIR
jgi:hypothetical protein